MSKRTKVLRGIVHILMALYIVVILFPLLWMVLSGFKSDADIFSSPWSLPESWKISNYIYVWTTYIQKSVLNSLFFTVVGTFFVVLISGMAAYAIIRLNINILFLCLYYQA